MNTYTLKQLRNAYEYMVSHGRTSINEERISSLVETADVWDKNGRRDCFVTGDLSVEVKKVPDSELKPYYREAARIVKETFPEQAEIMVEAYVRLCMFTEIATSALKDIAGDKVHARLCANAALADMEKDASKFPRPFGWKFGMGFFERNVEG